MMKTLLHRHTMAWVGEWFIGLTLLLGTAHSHAQVAPTGTVSGVVKDAAGLAVPNAAVTLVNADSNYTRKAITRDDGAYSFVALPIGRYDVKVESTGFKTETQTGLTLDVFQEAKVNFSLKVGAVDQQVVVKADEARVDTTSISLGHVVDNKQIVELPLNGRNFIDLTLLQTGITQFQNNNFGTNGLYGQFYSSNGAPIRSNAYTLDGAIIGNIQGASASSISGIPTARFTRRSMTVP